MFKNPHGTDGVGGIGKRRGIGVSAGEHVQVSRDVGGGSAKKVGYRFCALQRKQVRDSCVGQPVGAWRLCVEGPKGLCNKIHEPGGLLQFVAAHSLADSEAPKGLFCKCLFVVCQMSPACSLASSCLSCRLPYNNSWAGGTRRITIKHLSGTAQRHLTALCIRSFSLSRPCH